MKRQILKWIQITRPGTLAASSSPVFIGFIVAAESGSLDYMTGIITLVAALALQIASNLINDYYDFKKGLDKADRVGFRRAIAEGDVTPEAMRNAIIIDIIVAGLCGVYLFFIGGWPILVIGCTSLFCAWLYTATPYSLSYLGIADLFVLLFFGPVATFGTVYLQLKQFSGKAVWLGIICGLVSTGILTTNNLRDIETDRAAGKHTLSVRFGKRFGEMEYLAIYLLMIPCLYMGGSKGLCYLMAAAGIWLFWRVVHAKGKEYNTLLVFTGLTDFLYVILYFIEFMWL